MENRGICFALVCLLALALPVPLHGNNAEVAEGHVQTGDAYYAQGQFADAEQAYKAARLIFKSTHGEDHPVIGSVCTKLGALYDSMGDKKRALEAQEEGLKISKQNDGTMSEAYAGQLFNIGNIFWGQDKLPEALKRYTEALGIYEQVLGKDSERVGATQGNIGGIQYLMGKYDAALEAQNEALRIDRQFAKSQQGQQQLAMSLFNLGHTLHKLRQVGQAEHRYKEAIFFFRKIYGKEHPTIANALSSLGNLKVDQGNLQEALDTHLQALAMLIRTVGEDHPQTALCIYTLGTVYTKVGHHQDALESYVDAAGIYTKVLGKDAGQLGKPYMGAAQAKKALGQMNAARKAATEALRLFKLAGEQEEARECQKFLAALDSSPGAPKLPDQPA
eukprot:CAMPEP_0173435034 /NCGR_PEP_ID=MMETSP1357-20121228/14023_1 /TAXON_ID=77926 /ORGANISM="Hemiselmis rufescens, Strain PCC563" /LENGTH=389 /DNA_ID=CAMNT_0014399969 /DNA_START=51 /DNA_END=1220 /DNA_ORIENTATION=-